TVGPPHAYSVGRPGPAGTETKRPRPLGTAASTSDGCASGDDAVDLATLEACVAEVVEGFAVVALDTDGGADGVEQLVVREVAEVGVDARLHVPEGAARHDERHVGVRVVLV